MFELIAHYQNHFPVYSLVQFSFQTEHTLPLENNTFSENYDKEDLKEEHLRHVCSNKMWTVDKLWNHAVIHTPNKAAEVEFWSQSYCS